MQLDINPYHPTHPAVMNLLKRAIFGPFAPPETHMEASESYTRAGETISKTPTKGVAVKKRKAKSATGGAMEKAMSDGGRGESAMI